MTHPVVIIGAGPIGLAAAANAAERGLPYVVLEAGPHAGAAVGEWAHVRLFSAWRELVDPVARGLLDAAGVDGAGPRRLPDRRGVARALPAAARRPAGRAARRRVRYDATVVGVGRAGRDLLVDSGREQDDFAVHVAVGSPQTAGSSGCSAGPSWTRPAPGGDPNPLGADGYPAAGERVADRPDHLRHPRPRRPRRRRTVLRQARRAGRQGGLGAGRAGRADPAGAGRPGHPRHLAAAPAGGGRRIRRRRQRPARGARPARRRGPVRRVERCGHHGDPRSAPRPCSPARTAG